MHVSVPAFANSTAVRTGTSIRGTFCSRCKRYSNGHFDKFFGHYDVTLGFAKIRRSHCHHGEPSHATTKRSLIQVDNSGSCGTDQQ
jgi:hypothetical protein